MIVNILQIYKFNSFLIFCVQWYFSNIASTYQACQNGFTDIATQLLYAGIDVNAKSSRGITALFQAAQAGLPRIVKEILDHGINVKIDDGRLIIESSIVKHCHYDLKCDFRNTIALSLMGFAYASCLIKYMPIAACTLYSELRTSCSIF